MIVVLVNGLPGAGKTTLARPLAAALGLPLFSKDRIKEALADTLEAAPGLSARQWSARLDEAAGESLWALLADAGRGAVLDGFWPAELRDVVAVRVRQAGVVAHEVRCVVPPPVARRRHEEQEAYRHPIHRGVLVDDAQWEELERRAGPLGLAHTHYVDTCGPVDVGQLAECLKDNC